MTSLYKEHVPHFRHDFRTNLHNRGQDKQITDNKKVLLFLKQQMNNIRQGMNKIMRAKSEQSIKIIQSIKQQQSKPRLGAPAPKNIKHQLDQLSNQPKQMRKKIIYLQKQNQRLSKELQQAKQVKNAEIFALNNIRKGLQTQRQALNFQLIRITQEFQKLKNVLKSSRQIIKSTQQPAKKSKKTQLAELPLFDPSQIQLNPQSKPVSTPTLGKPVPTSPKILQNQPLLKINLDLIIRQNQTLKSIIRRMQFDISIISVKNIMFEKALQWSNKQIINSKLKILQNKYKDNQVILQQNI